MADTEIIDLTSDDDKIVIDLTASDDEAQSPLPPRQRRHATRAHRSGARHSGLSHGREPEPFLPLANHQREEEPMPMAPHADPGTIQLPLPPSPHDHQQHGHEPRVPLPPPRHRLPRHRIAPHHVGADNGDEWDVEYTDSLYLYTDGSYSHKLGGAGIAYRVNDVWNGRAVALGRIKGSHQAELLAIKHAISMAEDLLTAQTKKRLVICTDALGAQEKLSAGTSRNHGVEGEIRSEQERLKRSGIEVQYSWVKGHSLNSGNERADMLAGFASKESNDPSNWERVYDNPPAVDLAESLSRPNPRREQVAAHREHRQTARALHRASIA